MCLNGGIIQTRTDIHQVSERIPHLSQKCCISRKARSTDRTRQNRDYCFKEKQIRAFSIRQVGERKVIENIETGTFGQEMKVISPDNTQGEGKKHMLTSAKWRKIALRSRESLERSEWIQGGTCCNGLKCLKKESQNAKRRIM